MYQKYHEIYTYFSGWDDPIQFDCGQVNASYTIGRTEVNTTIARPEIGIEKGYEISVWACDEDSCDPSSVTCYDSNSKFVTELPDVKKCDLGVSHCIRYGNDFNSNKILIEGLYFLKNSSRIPLPFLNQ